MILRFPALSPEPTRPARSAPFSPSLFTLPAAYFLIYSAGLHRRIRPRGRSRCAGADAAAKARTVSDRSEDDESEGIIMVMAGAHHPCALHRPGPYPPPVWPERRRKPASRDYDEPYDFNGDEFGTLNEPSRPKSVPAPERVEPSLDRSERRIVAAPADVAGRMTTTIPRFRQPPPHPPTLCPTMTTTISIRLPIGRRFRHRANRQYPRPRHASFRQRPVQRPASAVDREAQTSLVSDDGDFTLPPLHLLAEPKNVTRATRPCLPMRWSRTPACWKACWKTFGVRGEIIHVRPGPVVTLYELEPAPGIKSSRVIGSGRRHRPLDERRSPARVAVVPGRNAIGIELPNQQARDRLSARTDRRARISRRPSPSLALMALGKTIGGEPVIVDLAKMPHVLVAGTTGSGKSVAINTMILSILYRLKPEQCRLIMVDPKMLELSVYDGIPHLLTPVVTDPKKAVVALKWTVREMEERYKKMSKLGVRNIDGFNVRVARQAAGQGRGRSAARCRPALTAKPARQSSKAKNSISSPCPISSSSSTKWPT